jgi:hypothetical protein
MRARVAVIFLVYVVSVNAAEEPKKSGDDAGRELRKMFLTMPAEAAGIQRSPEFPHVWAVAMDWPIGQQIATIAAIADGSASLYTTGTFGIIGGVGHENVRTAAKQLVKKAESYHDASTASDDLSYPALDRVRFYFRTFDGIRVIDISLRSVTDERGRYSDLFDLAQVVITELRKAGEQK